MNLGLESSVQQQWPLSLSTTLGQQRASLLILVLFLVFRRSNLKTNSQHAIPARLLPTMQGAMDLGAQTGQRSRAASVLCPLPEIIRPGRTTPDVVHAAHLRRHAVSTLGQRDLRQFWPLQELPNTMVLRQRRHRLFPETGRQHSRCAGVEAVSRESRGDVDHANQQARHDPPLQRWRRHQH